MDGEEVAPARHPDYDGHRGPTRSEMHRWNWGVVIARRPNNLPGECSGLEFYSQQNATLIGRSNGGSRSQGEPEWR